MESKLVIPAELGALNSTAQSNIERAFAEFESLIVDEQPFFFPEYTGHGRRHLNSVLKLSSWLLDDKAKKEFTEKDIEWLCYAVLLHDSAMHFTDIHFRMLVEDKIGFELLPSIHKALWSTTWSEYINESTHWTSVRREEIFGKDIEIPEIPRKHEPWTIESKMLVGEFLRRHHHSLAYCIAVNGLPKIEPNTSISKASNSFLKLLGPEPWENVARDLIGTIAQSHGLPLRQSFDELKNRHRDQLWKSTHPTLLMVLLRLSDFFQFSERANVSDMPNLRSPISKLEWAWNQDVADVSVHNADRLAVIIDLEPRTIETFIKLQGIVHDLQSELDNAWAVLGECYSSNEDGLRIFATDGLRFRRVRTTIDSPSQREDIQAKYGYIPQRVELSISQHALPLLAEPIYGTHYSYAIREMMANALDAVRRRKNWLGRGNKPASDSYVQETDIKFELKELPDQSHSLICTDTGIGMSLETIQDYFLTAGHSYRNSKDESTTQDRDHLSSIVGRFGIGSLSYLLLDNHVNVITRHISAQCGYAFEITSSTKPINIRPVYDCPYGTQIEAILHKPIRDRSDKSGLELYPALFLSRDFHHLWQGEAVPSIHYSLPDFDVVLTDLGLGNGDEVINLDGPRLVLDETSFNCKIVWSSQSMSTIEVNGIFVSVIQNLQGWPPVKLKVEDPNGLFRLNLARNIVHESAGQIRKYIVDVLVDRFIKCWRMSESWEHFLDRWHPDREPCLIMRYLLRKENSFYLTVKHAPRSNGAFMISPTNIRGSTPPLTKAFKIPFSYTSWQPAAKYLARTTKGFRDLVHGVDGGCSIDYGEFSAFSGGVCLIGANRQKWCNSTYHGRPCGNSLALLLTSVTSDENVDQLEDLKFLEDYLLRHLPSLELELTKFMDETRSEVVRLDFIGTNVYRDDFVLLTDAWIENDCIGLQTVSASQ